MNSARLILSLSLASLPFLPCLASDDAFQREVSCFRAGDFSAALAAGTEALNRAPSNTVARYYAAQALVKLQRTKEAIEQFNECQRRSTDPVLSSYCRQELAVLTHQPIAPPSTATQAVGAPTQGGAAQASSTQPSAPESDLAKSDPGNVDLLERKADVIQQGVKEIDFLRKQADEDIAKINSDGLAQIHDIPQYIDRSYVTGRQIHVRQVPNPDYDEAVERMRTENKPRIDEINRRFEQRQAEITAQSKHKADLYDEVANSNRSQQKPGTSLIQMTPQNTNTYVRNFVNYDGYKPPAPPEALRAQAAGSLSSVTKTPLKSKPSDKKAEDH